MYKTILVPLDGSKRAEAILPHVEDLAQRYQARVILLQVVEPEPVIVATEPVYTGYDPERHLLRVRAVENYLKMRRGEFQEKGIETQIILGDGPIVEEIINIADRENVDLIAMASHGRTGLPRAFYGSVAAGILHRIDRPLLLVRSVND
jgi:nucleotide-binding universal stress UspA family protein